MQQNTNTSSGTSGAYMSTSKFFLLVLLDVHIYATDVPELVVVVLNALILRKDLL